MSYLIRTLSWKFILADDGFVLGTLKGLGIIDDAFRILATPTAVIFGLVYNFLLFMVLPLYVSLDKIDRSLIEAAEDLARTGDGVSRARCRCRCPGSSPGRC